MGDAVKGSIDGSSRISPDAPDMPVTEAMDEQK
jgi:hypothetical protein